MKTLTILVIDDDPVLRTLLGERLKKAGYTIELAEDGYVAKSLLEKTRYDVILTDLIMPNDIGGIEILSIAKEIDHSMEVLLITAHSSVDTAVEAMKKGAYDYLEKPINFAELFLKLDKIAHVNTIYQSALDLRSALSRTEEEAAQTIQTLELLSNSLQQSLEAVKSALQSEETSSEDKIANALTIIAQT